MGAQEEFQWAMDQMAMSMVAQECKRSVPRGDVEAAFSAFYSEMCESPFAKYIHDLPRSRRTQKGRK